MKRVFLIFGEDDALKAARLMPLLRSPVYEVDFYQGPAHPDFDSDEAEAVRRAMERRSRDAISRSAWSGRIPIRINGLTASCARTGTRGTGLLPWP
jgi:hypothetical protein